MLASFCVIFGLCRDRTQTLTHGRHWAMFDSFLYFFFLLKIVFVFEMRSCYRAQAVLPQLHKCWRYAYDYRVTSICLIVTCRNMLRCWERDRAACYWHFDLQPKPAPLLTVCVSTSLFVDPLESPFYTALGRKRKTENAAKFVVLL